MKVRYTVPAQVDLEGICDYVSEHNPFAAERIKRQIKTDTELLGELPFVARESGYPGHSSPQGAALSLSDLLFGHGGRGSHPPRPSRRTAVAMGRQ